MIEATGVHWAAISTIAVPALVSVVAAVFALYQAREARQSEAEAERLRRLEDRVSTRKAKVYEPIIETLDLLVSGRPPDDSDTRVNEFRRWVAIYGSDEANRAFWRFMQSTYVSAPAPILTRMYVEFVLEARRDLGDDQTKLTPVDYFASKITDLFTDDDPTYYEAVTADLDVLFAQHNWIPPWERRWQA